MGKERLSRQLILRVDEQFGEALEALAIEKSKVGAIKGISDIIRDTIKKDPEFSKKYEQMKAQREREKLAAN